MLQKLFLVFFAEPPSICFFSHICVEFSQFSLCLNFLFRLKAKINGNSSSFLIWSDVEWRNGEVLACYEWKKTYKRKKTVSRSDEGKNPPQFSKQFRTFYIWLHVTRRTLMFSSSFPKKISVFPRSQINSREERNFSMKILFHLGEMMKRATHAVKYFCHDARLGKCWSWGVAGRFVDERWLILWDWWASLKCWM
jgi:hypothetical protein